MFVDYVLPDVEFTVDELAILPDECRYECTREVFTATDPFPVAVNLPRLSDRWPQTFEYAGRRDPSPDAR
jgi:hypothetical protein